MNRPVSHFFATVALVVLGASTAAGQSFESVGSRALGMGGAFVAVANDSSATWWNPAGLAAGPFLDLAIARTMGDADSALPASRTGVWSVSIATPPLGASYYRFRITDIPAEVPTGTTEAGREDTTVGPTVRSLSVSQLGATVLHTITTGVNVGATVKYVRGTPRVQRLDASETVVGIPELLDLGNDLEGGDSDGTVDADVGVLVTVGAARFGATARNLFEPEFGDRRIERQFRAGAAFDGAAAGMTPVMVSVDVDLQKYAGPTGERQVVAVGVEHWLRPKRVAIRGGGRFNTAAGGENTVTTGASVAVRAGLFVEGHAAYSSEPGESGWGLAARASF
jgi:hypothetical protein